VLLVGAGNSGAEIAVELARHGHKVLMSGRDTGHVPFNLGGVAGRYFLTRFVLRFLFHRLLTLNTPLGRRARASVLSRGGPLIRVKPKQLAAAGVERVGRTMGVMQGKPVLADGREVTVSNVIWCTGFDPASSWVHVPVFGRDGQPIQQRGVVANQPGLYFVGRQFLFAMSSTMIHGVGRDAAYLAKAIAARVAEQPKPQSTRPINMALHASR
jgi:putative flavoprotein involved in K+ transport